MDLVPLDPATLAGVAAVARAIMEAAIEACPHPHVRALLRLVMGLADQWPR